MTFKEITDLIKWVNKYSLSEFKIKDGDFELTIRSDKYKHKSDAVPAAIPNIIPNQPAAVQSAPEQTTATPAANQPAPTNEGGGANKAASDLIEIKSPMVGTFYRSASPDKPPYIQVGDSISTGTVVCIIEAMKLFNEIEAEFSGKVVKILCDDASPVEYEQPLFLIDPKG